MCVGEQEQSQRKARDDVTSRGDRWSVFGMACEMALRARGGAAIDSSSDVGSCAVSRALPLATVRHIGWFLARGSGRHAEQLAGSKIRNAPARRVAVCLTATLAMLTVSNHARRLEVMRFAGLVRVLLHRWTEKACMHICGHGNLADAVGALR